MNYPEKPSSGSVFFTPPPPFKIKGVGDYQADTPRRKPNWGCWMFLLAVTAFWCVVVGMGWIILFRSCVLPWAWYCQ